MRKLKSVDEVIFMVGGVAVVAHALGVGRTVVSNWRARNKIPPSQFLTVNEILEPLGCQADEEIFSFKELELVRRRPLKRNL
jgi:hypothetical protein